MIHETFKIKTPVGVYVPQEDSFLVAQAVELYAFGKVIDLCTGSGIIGMVAAKMGCDVTFVDIDQRVLKCTQENVKANGLKGRFICSDLFTNIHDRYNTIVINPPYVISRTLKNRNSGLKALEGGIKGREIIERFIASYKEHLLDDHIVLMLESSQNRYQHDVRRLKADIVLKGHYFFEDLVVLAFK